MRLYAILPADVESTMARPIRRAVDEDGNPVLTGLVGGGRAIIVVIAKDDPGFVTTFPEH
ncbi:MAG: hypothetical protein WA862_09415 [Solirubrobacterales bacterium]